VSEIVTAVQVNELKTDIDKVRTHQIGSATFVDHAGTNFTLATTVAETDLIVAGAVDGNENPIEDTTNKSINDFDNAVSQIETDALLVDVATQTTLNTNAASSSRTTNWSTAVYFEFTVTFANANQRRYFFNTGGEIQIESSLVDNGTAKSQNWKTMIENAGIVHFNYNSTYIEPGKSGSASGSIGNSNLTANYQQIFNKAGSDVYAENDYKIEAKVVLGGAQTADQASVLNFKVSFLDDDTGDPPIVPVPQGGIEGGVDEPVGGTLETFVYERKTSGSVTLNSPTYNTVTALSSGG